jgi:hypothetical protein
MAHYSRDTYIRIFDGLLSEELCFSAPFASESNIRYAIKRVLGKALKMNYISLYSDLVIDSCLDVSFRITDPDGDIVEITLKYGE